PAAHDLVADEQGRRSLGLLEHGCGGPVGVFEGEVAVGYEAIVGLDACHRQGVAVAVESVARGCDLGVARDDADPPMPKLEQVLYSHPGTAAVVEVDARRLELVERRL